MVNSSAKSLTGVYTSDFSRVFSNKLVKACITCYRISEYTGLNESYLSRLRSGEKSNPSVATLMKISLALVHFGQDITLYDIEELFNSVGRSILI